MNKFSSVVFSTLLAGFAFCACLPGCMEPSGPGSTSCYYFKSDTTIRIDSVWIDIKIPAGSRKGTLLLLQGWDFPRTDWCDKSDFCKKALQKGYLLVMPETGKSIYHSSVYPETRKDWLQYPSGRWMWDSLIPIFQTQFCLFEKGKHNFVAGISTGGRGAALACLKLPDVFSAGASLSGDFEQRKTPEDNLMVGYYGPIHAFPERWSGEDNPNASWKKWKTPFLIAHGKADTVVPFSQSEIFYHTLVDSLHSSEIQFFPVENGGHDYANWASMTTRILDFFDSFISTQP